MPRWPYGHGSRPCSVSLPRCGDRFRGERRNPWRRHRGRYWRPACSVCGLGGYTSTHSHPKQEALLGASIDLDMATQNLGHFVPVWMVGPNQVKASVASALLRTGATALQICAAFDAVDAAPWVAQGGPFPHVGQPPPGTQRGEEPCDVAEAAPAQQRQQCHEFECPIADVAVRQSGPCSQFAIHTPPTSSRGSSLPRKRSPSSSTSQCTTSRRACRRFGRSGFCKYGESCFFPHVPPMLELDASGPEISHQQSVSGASAEEAPAMLACEESMHEGDCVVGQVAEEALADGGAVCADRIEEESLLERVLNELKSAPADAESRHAGGIFSVGAEEVPSAAKQMDPQPLSLRDGHVAPCLFLCGGSCRDGQKCRFSHLLCSDRQAVAAEVKRIRGCSAGSFQLDFQDARGRLCTRTVHKAGYDQVLITNDGTPELCSSTESNLADGRQED